MVLQNRLGYGFNGYQVPPTPRATRSPRRRCSIRKKVDNNQMCAFDLLATVAGKLLLEGQVSPSSSNTSTGKELCPTAKHSVKKEQLDEDITSKVEPSNLVSGSSGLHYSTKELPLAHNDDCSVLASVITDCSEKIGCTEKVVNGESKIEPGSSKMEPLRTGDVSNSTEAHMCTSGNLAVRYTKPPALVGQENRVNTPTGTNHVSFPACRDDVNVAVRDDDENSSGCTQPSTTKKAFRPPRIGDRRIRKILASKFWKAAPKLKDGEYFTADLETKPVYHNRKICYKRKRSLRDYPFKKRILLDGRSLSNSDGGITSEGISSSPRKGFSCDASGSGATLHGAFGTAAGVASRHTPFQSRDSHVKLRIKSFKVPELFIEIPETATVGSLKRSVMEAVNAILGGGLRVGVLLRGKKIRDDNKTLLQTGLSHDNKLDALGFSLEPTVSKAPPSLCNEEHPLLLSCNAPQPLTRYPPAPNVVHNIVEQSAADALPDPPLTSVGSFVESDHDSAPSPPDMSIDKSPMDSRALVAVPEIDAEALAVVPMRKSKRSEAVQRRIRRPFSVSEVEALVHAVEKLGTGRWRDVKLRAFDNAKHRTYVDLKDKWKTLVHTARISPQQRRGEPVPQDLLDRVLDAHAYWSQQAAKQQLKQQSETCLLF